MSQEYRRERIEPIQSRFGPIIGWAGGQLEPNGPPGVKLEWTDDEDGRANCRAFLKSLFDLDRPA